MEVREIYRNQVRISYTKSGRGSPLILLHGNGESNKLFLELSSILSEEGFVVYAPDTRGHGLSSKVSRLRYEDIADDIALLIRKEQMEKPVLFGFSDGGIAGLLVASKYPSLIGRLIVAGVNLSPKGIKTGVRFLMKLGFLFSRSDKLRLMLTQPDISDAQLKAIEAPTVIFYAQKDMVRLSDSRRIVDNVKDSKLRIIQGETHGSYIADNKKLHGLLTDVF